MQIAMVGPFGLRVKGTMGARALPLARALVRRGHRVRIVMPPWDSPADAGRVWNDAGVEIHCISLKGARFPRSSVRLAARLTSAALANNPDALHIFKPVGYSGIVGMWAVHRCHRPAILFDLDDLEGRRGWGRKTSRLPAETWLRDWQERWALCHADGLTVASRYLHEMAVAAGMAAERVTHLPNGCDVSRSSIGSPEWAYERDTIRSRHAAAGDTPVILWSTRFDEADLAWVAQVLSRIISACPNVRMWVAGASLAGEDEHWREIVDSSPALKSRVTKLGWLPAGEWEDIVLAADIGIVPLDDTPVNRARCPAKIPRMMARGLPLIAHAVGEATAYIADGQIGRLVPPDNADAFVQAVLELIDSPSRRRKYSQAASQRAVQEWHWDKLAASADLAYRVALGYNEGD